MLLFGQRSEGTLPKYAPSIFSAVDYPVYWTFIIILSSIGFYGEKVLMFLTMRSFCAVIYQ